MLLQKTSNQTILNTFNILVEIFIGFSVFAFFFGIFMNYFFTKYEVELLGKFIEQSISFYKGDTSYYLQQINIDNLINNNSDINNMKANVKQEDEEVNNYNKPYDNKLMYIILFMVFGLLTIILLPILLGIIRIDQINLKYIGTSILLHIILIVGFELFFLIFIITYINPVKLFNVFQNNKTTYGTYI